MNCGASQRLGEKVAHQHVGPALAVGSQKEWTAPPNIITCQSTLALVSSSSNTSIMGLGVIGSAEPWIARTRPLMLQGVPATAGLGLVTWNTTTALKSAPARACSSTKPPPAQYPIATFLFPSVIPSLSASASRTPYPRSPHAMVKARSL